jgi:hypothetical protein
MFVNLRSTPHEGRRALFAARRLGFEVVLLADRVPAFADGQLAGLEIVDTYNLEQAVAAAGRPADRFSPEGLVTWGDRDVELLALQAIATGGRAGRAFVLETFLDGPQFSVEGWVYDGRVLVAGITDKWTTEPFHLEYQHIHPSELPPAKVAEIVRNSELVVRTLGLDHCAFHLECKLGAEGFRVVEVAARAGGDYITSHLIPLSTGIDFYGDTIRVATGDEPCSEPGESLHAGVRFPLARSEGQLVGSRDLDAVLRPPEVEHVILEQAPGETIRAATPRVQPSASGRGHHPASGLRPGAARARPGRVPPSPCWPLHRAQREPAFAATTGTGLGRRVGRGATPRLRWGGRGAVQSQPGGARPAGVGLDGRFLEASPEFRWHPAWRSRTRGCGSRT